MLTLVPPQELKNPSTLETHKLDLLAEISNLKLKLASSERERCELEERTGVAQVCKLQKRTPGGAVYSKGAFYYRHPSNYLYK